MRNQWFIYMLAVAAPTSLGALSGIGAGWVYSQSSQSSLWIDLTLLVALNAFSNGVFNTLGEQLATGSKELKIGYRVLSHLAMTFSCIFATSGVIGNDPRLHNPMAATAIWTALPLIMVIMIHFAKSENQRTMC